MPLSLAKIILKPLCDVVIRQKFNFAYTDVSFIVCVCVCVCVHAHVLSHSVTQSRPTLSMGLVRQEYWNGLPFPTLGHLPNLGIEPAFPESLALAGGFFITEPPEKPHLFCGLVQILGRG